MTTIVIRILFVSSLIVSNILWADFGVATNNWPDEPPHYGNAQAQDFRDAMHGTTNNEYIESENQQTKYEQQIKYNEPFILDNRLYARFRFGFGKVKLKNIKNNSTGAFANATVTEPQIKSSQKTYEWALGYNWKKFRVDLEYMFQDDLDYNPNPAVTGSGAMTSKIKSNTFLLNGYWDFDEFYFIRPYLNLIAGFGFNKTEASLAGASAGNKKQTSLAFGLGVGTRIHIKQHFFADVALRAISLGKSKFQDGAVTVKLEGKRNMTGISLGLIYVF